MESDHAIGQLDMADRDLPHAAHGQAEGWGLGRGGPDFRAKRL
jgi:hypothetical protein